MEVAAHNSYSAADYIFIGYAANPVQILVV